MAKISKILWVAAAALALVGAAGVVVSSRSSGVSAGRDAVPDDGTANAQSYQDFPEGMLIDGYPVAGAYRARSGEVNSLVLSEPFPFHGDTLPADTEFWLDADRKIRACMFREDTIIQGHRVRGGWTLDDGYPSVASFYPGGRLYNFAARDDVVLQGVPCRGSSFRPITLHENGNLRSCALSREVTVGGVDVKGTSKADQMVYLNERGEVRAVGEVPWIAKGLEWGWPVYSHVPGRFIPEPIIAAARKELGAKYPSE